MFALLGTIQLGLSPFTHPTGAEGNEKSKLARIDVAVGKPAVQDMGDDLAGTRLSFFFDESFCDPETEMNRLREARRSRAPLAYVPGDGSFRGVRFIVEEIGHEIKKTTLSGRVVRIEAHLTLIEAPVDDLEGLATALQKSVAPALAANFPLNVLARK